jgi:hypothetical protein
VAFLLEMIRADMMPKAGETAIYVDSLAVM